MCFLIFQANFILVPFPTHRQQVPSLCVCVCVCVQVRSPPFADVKYIVFLNGHPILRPK